MLFDFRFDFNFDLDFTHIARVVGFVFFAIAIPLTLRAIGVVKLRTLGTLALYAAPVALFVAALLSRAPGTTAGLAILLFVIWSAAPVTQGR